MVSGIVYFDEIIENIKDATGIQNMRPLYSRVRRFCFNVEDDIGAGGVIVLKKKEYTKGDGFYDGKTLRLPNDFVSEWTYGGLADGVVQGNVFKLFDVGADKIDFKYLGFLLDEEGNPFTTRNRLQAVVKYSIFRLYSTKYFIGTGNRNQYMGYEQDYEDAVMEARGNDAFPTEEDWNTLGAIRNGGTFEAMTDCGMRMIYQGELDPSTLDTTLPEPEPVCKEFIEGIINGKATVIGELEYMELIPIDIAISGQATVSGTLTPAVLTDMALIGQINGAANLLGNLANNVPLVLCSESYNKSGGVGTFEFTLELGTAIGLAGLDVEAYAVPDRFRIEWNGIEVANSKFIGSSTYEAQLLALGYTQEELDLGDGTKELRFMKSASSPTYARVFVEAPIGGTAWKIDGVCPVTAAGGKATVSGTLTPQ